MSDFILKDDERLDDLHINNYKIIQNVKKFCFGMDAVLLSDFAKGKTNDKVLDIGTGTGIIPILMSAKCNAFHYVGIEVQQESASMATRSVNYNNLSTKITILNEDIKNISNHFERGHFDIVTTNPPYMLCGTGEINTSKEMAIARHELLCNLEDIVNYGNIMLKFGGHFYMVHRPSRLVDIFCIMRQYKIEPKTIRLVQPFASKEPNLVLVHGIKGGKSGLITYNNLIVYNEDGSYTEELNKIYIYSNLIKSCFKILSFSHYSSSSYNARTYYSTSIAPFLD